MTRLKLCELLKYGLLLDQSFHLFWCKAVITVVFLVKLPDSMALHPTILTRSSTENVHFPIGDDSDFLKYLKSFVTGGADGFADWRNAFGGRSSFNGLHAKRDGHVIRRPLAANAWRRIGSG